MKLSLIVLAAGKQAGKVLEIKLPQFLVGRDPQCHLRPASPLISKRHCVILQREGKAFVRDFDSTNGTFLNNQPVKGEVEIHNDDRLKIGPLLFTVRVESGAPVNRPTPAPPTKAVTKPGSAPAVKASAAAAATPKPAPQPAPQPAAQSAAGEDEPAPAPAPAAGADAGQSDDDIAAMLLSIQDDGTAGPIASGEVPEGSTVMDLAVPPGVEQDPAKAGKGKEAEKAKAASGNTSSAAKSILEKYMRRPRT
jgi:pSer/pThr/pTyr-binding forkhead associated (FHA) protein